jgi:hypothetical protein
MKAKIHETRNPLLSNHNSREGKRKGKNRSEVQGMTDRSARAANTSLWARSGAFRILVIAGLLVLITVSVILLLILLLYVFREYGGFVLVLVVAVLIAVGRRRAPRKPKEIVQRHAGRCS